MTRRMWTLRFSMEYSEVLLWFSLQGVDSMFSREYNKVLLWFSLEGVDYNVLHGVQVWTLRFSMEYSDVLLWFFIEGENLAPPALEQTTRN
ncbi:hypothetical protein EYF80_031064 [Liparis tanakae]|uniref:Uncharacterized protein n=1 Tax=Liparis tanakae TaxID=230148 RepID=A0A4Z2GZ38_9TELE|nr:hypothetical protein EYF80_031064 [Liparis tanakae]